MVQNCVGRGSTRWYRTVVDRGSTRWYRTVSVEEVLDGTELCR